MIKLWNCDIYTTEFRLQNVNFHLWAKSQRISTVVRSLSSFYSNYHHLIWINLNTSQVVFFYVYIIVDGAGPGWLIFQVPSPKPDTHLRVGRSTRRFSGFIGVWAAISRPALYESWGELVSGADQWGVWLQLRIVGETAPKRYLVVARRCEILRHAESCRRALRNSSPCREQYVPRLPCKSVHAFSWKNWTSVF